jgi:hypothetical protein
MRSRLQGSHRQEVDTWIAGSDDVLRIAPGAERDRVGTVAVSGLCEGRT